MENEPTENKNPVLKVSRETWAFLTLLAITLVLLYFNTLRRSMYLPDTRSDDPSPPSASVSIPITPSASPTPSKVILRVSYHPPKKQFAPIALENGPFSVELTLQSIGVVQEGPYKDWAVIRSEHPFHHSKGGGGTSLRYLRLLQHETTLVYLPHVSDPNNAVSFVFSQQKNQGLTESFPKETVNAFTQAGYQLTVDERVTIPELEYAPLSGPEGSQFTYINEGAGTPDLNALIQAFSLSNGTPVWTTKPGKGPAAYFYTGEELTQTVVPAIGCRGSQCYTSNGFYLFRPDGTFTVYAYQLPFNPQLIQWNTAYQGSQETEFSSATRIGCGSLHADVVSITPPNILSLSDVVPIGTFNNGTESVYGIKDAHHPFLKQFYAAYSGEVPEWWRTERLPTDTYEEFISRNPVFFFQDPFGRLIRLTNTHYVPPYACEPILYLYPERPMDLSIHFDSRVQMLASVPAYTDSWNVTAHPDGSIINLEDAKEYPYLFWEGYAGTIPSQNEGFVLAQEQIGAFFRDMLPRLGLNKKESADFIAAWEPRFSDAPYYRISFLSTEFLDHYAPFTISPQPDTVIRVWIDYQPLPAAVRISAQSLPTPPMRQGFTVVEWGGLTR